MRPTEYTAALFRQLQVNRDAICGARALEIGCGSGALLGVLAMLGARSVCGVDIEEEAVSWSSSLLQDIGHDHATVHCGDLWQPVAGRKFDIIAANLPHFPMLAQGFGSRLPSWGCGGFDGRRLLDPFLKGLPDHLEPGGQSLITHNAFVDLDQTRQLLDGSGLSLRVLDTVTISIPPEKLALMTPLVLLRERDRSLWRVGPYAFGEMHIVQITSRSGS